MREALDLAQTVTAETTAPNPQVGCVLVEDNEWWPGYHPKAENAHQIFALRDAGATVEREGDGPLSVARPQKCDGLRHANRTIVGKTPLLRRAGEGGLCARRDRDVDPAPWVAGNGAGCARARGRRVLEDAACLHCSAWVVASLNLVSSEDAISAWPSPPTLLKLLYFVAVSASSPPPSRLF